MEPIILEQEVKAALKDITNGKSPGINDIPIEMWKNLGYFGIKMLTALCNLVWKGNIWPTNWKRSVFVPIPKKGDSQIFSNNRTIALISHTRKVLRKIVQKRMSTFTNSQLPEEQAGFRKY